MKEKIDFILIISVLLFFVFALLAASIQSNFIAMFDVWVIEAVQMIKTPILTDLMKLFTYIGDTDRVIIISILVAIIIYLQFRKWRDILLFVTVLIGSATFMRLLKNFFQRERPSLYGMISVGGYSFPSGHSMMALALYGIICFLLWKHIRYKVIRIILLILAIGVILIIGFSRIYLGVHYPSDIIGGYLFSGFWLLIAVWGFQRFQREGVKQKESS